MSNSMVKWGPQCIMTVFYLHILYTSTRFRTRWWLEWVAPNSTSNIGVLSMTYSTPVPLSRAGQGAFLFTLLFHFGCTWPSWRTWDDPETLEVTTSPVCLRPEASALNCSSSSLLSFRSCSILHNSSLTSTLWSNKSHTQLNILSLSFSASSASWARQSHLWCNSLISSAICSCVRRALDMAS